MLKRALTSSTTSETANSWLGDALDVVAQNFTMTLSTGLCKSGGDQQRPTNPRRRPACCQETSDWVRVEVYSLPRPLPPFPRPDMFLY